MIAPCSTVHDEGGLRSRIAKTVGGFCYIRCGFVRPWMSASGARRQFEGLSTSDPGHTGIMAALLIVISGVALWCLVPLPMAVVVGRAFRAGEVDGSSAEMVRDYEAVGT